MSPVWMLQDAKNAFSEVVNRACSSGPQIVTRRGRPVAVVIHILFSHRQHIRAISAPGQGRVGKQPAAEDMVPPQPGHRIAPTQPELASGVRISIVCRIVFIVMVVEDVLLTVGPEIVFPSVVIRKYTVPGSEAMRNLCVDIIE